MDLRGSPRGVGHLGLARACALQDDTARAKVAYQDFLTLWKDDDPDIPTVTEARAEYARTAVATCEDECEMFVSPVIDKVRLVTTLFGYAQYQYEGYRTYGPLRGRGESPMMLE